MAKYAASWNFFVEIKKGPYRALTQHIVMHIHIDEFQVEIKKGPYRALTPHLVVDLEGLPLP